MRAVHSVFLLAALGLSAGSLDANDGDADPGFGTDAEFPGYGFYPGPFGSGTLSDSVIGVEQGLDGKLYVFADVQAMPAVHRALIYRLDPNGLPDDTFDTFGHITIVPPCAAGRLVDAKVDGLGRPWLLFSGCGDYEVYRLTPDGDADTSLLGSGRLTIGFNLGGDNSDFPSSLTFTASGGVVIAGRVNSPTGRRLGLAHFTADGGAMPGFGNAGRVDFDFNYPVTRIGGVHAMSDGRIVAAGDTQNNFSEITQFVVRVQPSGAGDLGFGNKAPGVSEINLRTATMNGIPAGAATQQSILERNGAIVQVGVWNAPLHPQQRPEMLLLRWRPDGQLDTSVGPFGYRLYGLDQGGNPGNQNTDSDRAQTLVRQGDGKYILAGVSINSSGQSELAMLRLERDFEPDLSFGTAGWVTDRLALGPDTTFNMQPRNVLVRPGSILTALMLRTPSGYATAVRGSSNDLLFADTFD